MAHSGETIDNPVTGERVKWHLTSSDTGGRLVRAECWARPGGGAGFLHVHREAEERVEVLAGRMAAELDDRRADLAPGHRILLPAGIPHRWWNAGGEDLHFMFEVEPAGRFEEALETLFMLGREGRLRANGAPRLLQRIVIARRYALRIHGAGRRPHLRAESSRQWSSSA